MWHKTDEEDLHIEESFANKLEMRWRGWALAVLTGGFISMPAGCQAQNPAASARAGSTWVESSHADFSRGTFDDGGAELYTPASGGIRFINQFDLNGDGSVDLLFCDTHGMLEKPDALIYWGSNGKYPPSRVTPVATDGAYYSLVDDLDGDGWPDLVLINCDNGITSVLDSFVYWGGPKGYSANYRSEIQTFNPRRCVAADLNGDGYKELIIPNGQYRRGNETFDDKGVCVYRGSKEGYSDYDVERIPVTNVKCVAVGEFAAEAKNKHARPDLFVGTSTGPSFVYFNHNGSFDIKNPVQLDCRSPQQAVAIDLDGNGKTGLLINGGPGIAITYYTAEPTDPTRFHEQKLGVDGGKAIACADLDGDGCKDLIVAGATEKESRVYWGASSGFSPDRCTKIKTEYASDVVVADLNRDGHPDVIISQELTEKMFDVDSLILWGSGQRDIGQRVSRLPGSGTMGISVGDIRKDGNLDIVLTRRAGGLRVGHVPSLIYWNDGHGDFSTAHRTELVTNDCYEAAAADFNGDGYPDVVFAEQYETQGEVGKSRIFWGSAKGFTQDNSTGLMTHGAMGVSVADLNRDGYLDILFGQLDRVAISAAKREDLVKSGSDKLPECTGASIPARHMSRIFWGGPNGYSIKNMTELPSGETGTPAIADLNHDNWLDLVFPSPDNKGARIFWGGPNGFHEAKERICFERTFKCQVVDLNGDGWLDLIFCVRAKGRSNDTNSIVYWGGPNGFSEKRRLDFPTRGVGTCSVADLNHDGILDVVFSNYASDETRQLPLYIYWGTKQGWSPMWRTSLPTQSGSGTLIADFNNDGWLDIAVACHRKEGSRDFPGYPNTHEGNSYIYWGSAEGFDASHRTEVPTIGPHGMTGIDIGNIYDRKPVWLYTSSAHDFGSAGEIQRVNWSGKAPKGTSIELQVRSADTEQSLASASWTGPKGANSWFDARAKTISLKAGRFVQYRVRFWSKLCALYPGLDRVEIGFRDIGR
ncbi:MAG TPA: VCBS repeat-containing protein [Tepidisphaeraceae bacterium]|nr:VCBS repeat-containing protein [Tepidisphaeraceae bacterium]